MHSIRSIIAAWLLWTTYAVAQTIVPTDNTTWLAGEDTSHSLVLEMNRGLSYFYLQPLNNASFETISDEASQSNGLGGNLYLGQPVVNNNWTEDDIALISCDPYQGEITVQDVANDAIKSNVTAIIFYSTVHRYCNATGLIYNAIYSTTILQNSTFLSAPMNNANIMGKVGVIFTKQAFEEALAAEGSNSPSTAVAMIILYSITGVITALFLLIIITGAVRAHRHPERYGPRNILGGTRQSRARGIARAMLDTIPIVKFGDNPADTVNKDPDLELNSTSSSSMAHNELQNMTSQHGREADKASGDQKKDTTLHVADGSSLAAEDNESGEGGSRRATSSNGDTSGQAAPSTNTTHSNGGSNAAASGVDNSEDGGLGCSICTDDFERGQDIRVLPCNHKFHPACVDPWLLDVSGTCPLCRIDLRPEANRSNENENGNDLPPPLDANHNEARRMSTLRTLFMFNRGSLSNASPEERIAALRRFRELNRRARRGPTDATVESHAETTSEENGNRLSRLFRHRRSVVEPNAAASAEQVQHGNVESGSGNSSSHQ